MALNRYHYMIFSVRLKLLMAHLWFTVPSKIQSFLPNFLLRKFSVNGQFLQIFRETTQNYGETARLWKNSIRKLSRKYCILRGTGELLGPAEVNQFT